MNYRAAELRGIRPHPEIWWAALDGVVYSSSLDSWRNSWLLLHSQIFLLYWDNTRSSRSVPSIVSSWLPDVWEKSLSLWCSLLLGQIVSGASWVLFGWENEHGLDQFLSQCSIFRIVYLSPDISLWVSSQLLRWIPLFYILLDRRDDRVIVSYYVVSLYVRSREHYTKYDPAAPLRGILPIKQEATQVQ